MAATHNDFIELMPVPRGFLRFPLRVSPPVDFRAEALTTWPDVPGRLEYVAEELQYMPPCGVNQQKTVADLARALGNWRAANGRSFIVGTNEAGMKLGDDVRAADAAIWRSADQPVDRAGVFYVAPVLACEVAGRYENESALLSKAEWYLGHGTKTVWLLFPAELQVLIVTSGKVVRLKAGDTLDEPDELPGLTPVVDDLFSQLQD